MLVRLHLATESSAAKGIASRRGLGKTRHLDACFLWLQEKVNNTSIYIHKILGAENPADLLTKYLGPVRI